MAGTKLDELFIEIRGDDSKLGAVFKKLPKTVDKATVRMGNSIEKFSRRSTKSINKTKRSLDVFKGTFGAISASRVISLVGRELRDIGKNALEFSEALAEVNSILPKTGKLTLATKNQLIEFSNQFAGNAQTQAKAFYSIVSAGVQTTTKQLNVLREANQAAVAGLVDINTAARVLVSSMNTYAAANLTAVQASDALFAAVREGQTTFGELANSLGTAAPLAQAAGVTFAELAGSVAAITKAGISTDIALTGLRAIMSGVIAPSKQAADAAEKLEINFSTAGIRAKGFAEFLKNIKEQTGGSEEALAKLFPNVRALGPILAIVRGNFKDFVRILKATENSSGDTAEAFKVIAESAAFQFNRLTQQLENLPQAFFVNFDKPIAQSIKSIRAFVGSEGLLLVSGAVSNTISTFVLFNKVMTPVLNTFNRLVDLPLGVAQSFLEFNLAVIKTRISLRELSNLDNTELERLKTISEDNIESLEQFRIANAAAVNEREADDERLARSAEKLQQQIDQGRSDQIAANKKVNEKLAEGDEKSFARRQLAQEQFTAVQKTAAKDGEKLANALAEQSKQEEERSIRLKFEQEEAELDPGQFEEREAIFIEQQERRQELIEAQHSRELKDLKAAQKQGLITGKAFDESVERSRRKRNNNINQIELERTRFDKQQQAQRQQNLRDSLNVISTLTSSSNKTLFAIGKASAVATATIDGIAAVQKALASAPPPFNFILAGLVGVATLANVAKIASAKPPSFQHGIDSVPGIGNQDNFPALLAPRERVVPARTNQDLTQHIRDQKDMARQPPIMNFNITIEGGGLTPEEQARDMMDAINDIILREGRSFVA